MAHWGKSKPSSDSPGAASEPPSGGRSTGALTVDQRHVVLAVAISAVMLMSLTASFNYVIGDMVSDLNATETQTDTLRQIPSIAALLVVFIAGVLGQRLGERRVMLASSVLFAVGSAVMTVAPGMSILTFGQLLAGVGKSVLFVVGIALISASVSNKDGRAEAFGTFSAIQPIAYLLMPVIAGVLLGIASWRAMAAVWMLCGILATVAVWKWIPQSAHQGKTSTGEMVTPALAGVALAGTTQLINLVPNEGFTSRTWFYLIMTVFAVVALVAFMRRLSQPSLNLKPLRHGGLLLLLVVSILALFANLWFYMTMALQYIFGLTSLQVALAMMPVQICTIAAAKLAGTFIKRKGLTFAGGALSLLTALTLGASALIQLGTPLWVCIALTSVYAGAAVGAGVALTNAVMDLVPKEEAGSASSFRSAASSLGTAIGVAGMTTIVFATAATSLQQQSVAAGLDPTTSTQIAEAMRDGATSEEVSSQYAVPVSEVDEIDTLQQQAYLEGFQMQGKVGMLVTLGATGLYLLARRRVTRTQVEAPAH